MVSQTRTRPITHRIHLCTGAASRVLLLAILAIGTLGGLAGAAVPQSDSEVSLLVFFSVAEDPNPDPALHREMKIPDSVTLSYGTNVFAGKRYALIRASQSERDGYSAMRQPATFVIENSAHANAGDTVSRNHSKDMFSDARSLVSTCGRISYFFGHLAARTMGLDQSRIRNINLFDIRAYEPAKTDAKYLPGGHTVMEIYFPEYDKWAVFDLDMGVLPRLAGRPLSMYEIQSLPSSQVDFELLGHDALGKGPEQQPGVMEFYRAARTTFGIMTPELQYFLLSAPRAQAAIFQSNVELIYHRPAIMTTDRDVFYARHYQSPG